MADNTKNNISTKLTVDIKPDGVFLSVFMPNGAEKPTRQEIIDLLSAYGIDDYDLNQIDEVVRDPKKASHVKVSNNASVLSADEVAYITFKDFNMKAYIMFSPPINEGALFTYEDILEMIKDSGVTYGLKTKFIKELAGDREYGVEYLIAEGTQAVDGENGYLDFKFNTKKKTLTPKQLEDGSVDYQNLELVEKTFAGTPLVNAVPPTQGMDGMDVKGNVLQARPGRPADKIGAGKNTTLSEDESTLSSEIDGQVEYVNRKVNVLPVLEINGDVDLSTGNIDFNGSVVIKGEISTNFSVRAKGNIEVYGVVEGAIIECESDAYFYAGIMGGEKAEIYVKGDVTSKFVDSCKLVSGGSINTKSIIHSEVIANNTITVSGKKGIVVGGRCCAGKEVNATSIGSYFATRTEIIVGNTPAMIEKYRKLMDTFEQLKFKIDKAEKVIDVLKSIEEELPEEKKDLLLKSFHTKIFLISEKSKTEKEIKELMPQLESKYGRVRASETIFPGVLIAIGSARMKVENEIPSASLVCRDNEIKIKSYY